MRRQLLAPQSDLQCLICPSRIVSDRRNEIGPADWTASIARIAPTGGRTPPVIPSAYVKSFPGWAYSVDSARRAAATRCAASTQPNNRPFHGTTATRVVPQGHGHFPIAPLAKGRQNVTTSGRRVCRLNIRGILTPGCKTRHSSAIAIAGNGDCPGCHHGQRATAAHGTPVRSVAELHLLQGRVVTKTSGLGPVARFGLAGDPYSPRDVKLAAYGSIALYRQVPGHRPFCNRGNTAAGVRIRVRRRVCVGA